jgi:hypothetical protein
MITTKGTTVVVLCASFSGLVTFCAQGKGHYCQCEGVITTLNPFAIMTLGITTTSLLELCRNLQKKAGKNLEEVTCRFPAFK